MSTSATMSASEESLLDNRCTAKTTVSTTIGDILQ